MKWIYPSVMVTLFACVLLARGGVQFTGNGGGNGNGNGSIANPWNQTYDAGGNALTNAGSITANTATISQFTAQNATIGGSLVAGVLQGVGGTLTMNGIFISGTYSNAHFESKSVANLAAIGVDTNQFFVISNELDTIIGTTTNRFYGH